MASFQDLNFTPAEFSRLTGIDKRLLSTLESQGLISTFRKKIGNVDRKMIGLQEMQEFHRAFRQISAHQNSQASEPKDHSGIEEGAGHQQESPSLDPSEIPQSGAVAAGDPIPVEAVQNEMVEDISAEEKELVAAATAFPSTAPHHLIQMFYNVKGGTGKSTLTAQYVMRAAMMGYKVLAIDLDGQGHLSLNLDVLDSHDRPTIYDVLINDLPMSDAIVNVGPDLDLVPANLGLCNIEIPLNQKPRREYRLEEAIDSVKDRYDLIVADTNPAASILNCSMLVAADLVNVVCATNPLSFHGMSLVMATIDDMKREFRRDFDVRIIPNMYDNREVISQEVLGELRAEFPEYCAETVINRSADLNEATKRRTAVFEVNSKGNGATDINHLTNELLFI